LLHPTATTADPAGAGGPMKSGFEPAFGISPMRHFAYRRAAMCPCIGSGLASSLAHRWRLRVISMVRAAHAVDDV
jgi:hypothetical protein